MRFLHYTFIGLLFVYQATAQLINTTKEDALAIKNRLLLVALPEEDKYLVSEKENQPDFLKKYRDDLEGQREAFKTVVLKHWKYNDSITVLPFKEAKSLMKKNPDKYAMLRYADKSQDRIYVNDMDSIPIVAWSRVNSVYRYQNEARYDFRMLTVTSLVIELPKRVVQVFLPKLSPSKGDFIYAIHQMDYIMNNVLQTEGRTTKIIYKEMPKIAAQLKTKTLLLDITEMNTKEGLRNIDIVKKYYPYPVKLVNYKEIETILQSADTNYACVVHARYDFHNSTFCICNTGDGKLYNYFISPTFDYGNKTDPTTYLQRIYYPTISILNLERYATGK